MSQREGGEGAPTYYFAKCSQKLDQNWTEMGVRVKEKFTL